MSWNGLTLAHYVGYMPPYTLVSWNGLALAHYVGCIPQYAITGLLAPYAHVMGNDSNHSIALNAYKFENH
jgi:hypothetical protein